jgi:hypothetical protein
MSWILHASDPHLGVVSEGQALDDARLPVAREDIETTQRVFRRTLSSLRPYVRANGRPAAAVISGDLTYKATQEGFDGFVELLEERADVLPEDRRRILIVPGNHDVDWDQPAGTLERYASFLGATRERGCTTPLLDGVDFTTAGPVGLEPGVVDVPHIVANEAFLIIPINSSNYCGTVLDLEGGWDGDEWAQKLEPLGDDREMALRQLQALRQHDIARVSRQQVEALKALFDALDLSVDRGDDLRLRIAVIHHQLLPVSAREELKAFESITNLGFVRQTLRAFGIDVVLHGHKHESSLYWDFARLGSDDITTPLRRILVVASPGHFRVNGPVMRALEFESSPAARNLKITTFNGVESYEAQPHTEEPLTLPAWLGQMQSESAERSVVRGRTTHETYARLCAQFGLDAEEIVSNVVCQIDDAGDAEMLPPDYPDAAAPGKQQWFTDLINWWQVRSPRFVREKVL